MFRTVLALISLLLSTSAFSKDDPTAINQRDKSAIGIVTVRVLTNGIWQEGDYFDRGTGAIIAPEGYVLTAAHLMTDDVFKLCASAPGSGGDKRCEIRFLRGGDPNKSAVLRITGPPVAGHDFLVLRLPAPQDEIDQPRWPSVTLARLAIDDEHVRLAGYSGDEPIVSGSGNALESSAGRIFAIDATQSCQGEGYGVARRASGNPSPGWSGGPVFNDSGRVVGIVLGKTCAVVGATSPDTAPSSRVLLVSDMPNLCTGVTYKCSYGFPGDIDPLATGGQQSWTQRLIGGSDVADQIVYGVKPIELARLNILNAACGSTSDQRLVETITADAESGSQLANVFQGIWPGCRAGAPTTEIDAGVQRLLRLADSGYAPAQYAAGLILELKVAPKIGGRLPGDPLVLTDYDRANLNRATAYVRGAAAQGWTAATYLMFEMCRNRLADCTPAETGRYLDLSVADLQYDALRVDAQLSLIGPDGGETERRFGFSRPLNWGRAISMLERAATPRAGATNNSLYTIYDNASAGYLAYFYGGGRFRGRKVVAGDPIKALQYSNGCFGNGTPGTPFVDFCRWVGAISGFNTPSNTGAKSANWAFLMALNGSPFFGNLAMNLASWSPDGTDIDQISCDLSDYLDFRPPPVSAQPQPRIAYCYFPRDPATS